MKTSIKDSDQLFINSKGELAMLIYEEEYRIVDFFSDWQWALNYLRK